MIDLGCGEGSLVYAIKKRFPNLKITGIDISPRRIKSLRNRFPKEKFYIRDVCNTNLKKNSFDVINCS
ncbi:class I SAM-dependent methyltransferase [Candidatus Woesearchaeota archaeon]|nr:class I SAM-dependent methyltransferase [Candidatus Woesearchaeota archaeon]